MQNRVIPWTEKPSIPASRSQIPTGEFPDEVVMLRVGHRACHAALETDNFCPAGEVLEQDIVLLLPSPCVCIESGMLT